MTAREHLIEKVARAIHQHSLDHGAEHAEWDHLTQSIVRSYRTDAQVAVDVVLASVAAGTPVQP